LLNKNREGDHRRALWEPYMDIIERSSASVLSWKTFLDYCRVMSL
jgi:hypothetical protein